MKWLFAFMRSPVSGWIGAGAVTISLGLLVYIQQLRVEAAHCKGRESVQEQVDRLTDKVVKGIEQSAADDVRAIRQEPDACADARLPDTVLDSLRD